FGFTGGTGGGSNVHEIMCFKADQITGSSSSAAGNVPPLSRVMAGSQIYIASYRTQNWWGQLTAQGLVEDTDTGIVTINPIANWDASCKLTGGSCDSTGKTVTAQTTRNLFTWNAGGKSLTWSNLSATQQTALGSTTTLGQTALAWLTGTRTNERKSDGTGSLRARDSLLGDIVGSNPTWVGGPNSPYAGTWTDLRHGGTMPETSKSYDSFASTQKTRTNAVYVGANDGFLHAFRSGKSKTDGTLDMTNNDGQELFAYMPDQVLRTINNTSNDNLALPSTSYGHNAFVDAPPGTGDLYYGGAWRTWLVGGLGLGGNIGGVVADDTSVSKGAIYALDITNPDSFGAGNVLGEWNSDNLICSNSTTCKDSLGSTVGTPLVRRLHDGNWAVIFPNGQNSKTGEAGIYIMTVAQSDGSRTFRYIKAAGPQMSGTTFVKRNGISQVTAADLDADHITDYVYGGDMFGNVWRFDLSSKTASDWAAGANPVFKADQPITTAIVVSSTTKNEIYRVILNFGTGRLFPRTLDDIGGSATGDHYLHGIWDSDMDAWNAKSTFAYKSLTLSGTATTVTTSELLTRTITESTYIDDALGVNGVRTVSQEKLCWKGSTNCSPSNKRGWRMKLPSRNEQIFYNPVLQDGLVLFNTTVPEVSELLSCDTQAAAGFTMALPPDTGVPEISYFKNSEWSGGVIAGYGASGVGSIITVRSGSRTFGTTQTTSGKPKTFELNPSANANFKRVTWIKRR
ncbi:MAG: PilC/PilY family type IV pilus protein, partial [Comamonas sp.]